MDRRKLLTSLLIAPFLSCAKNETQTIDAYPSFFMTHKRKIDQDNRDYFLYKLNEEEIYLTPNPEKNIGITPFQENSNLDSLKISKTNLTMESKQIYFIDKLILSQQDSIKIK